MASLHRDKETGRWIVQPTLADGRRPSWRTGTRNKTRAEAIKRYIEDLDISARSKHKPEPDTSAWVECLSDRELRRLVAWGLIGPSTRRERLTLDEHIKRYIASRPDVKPNTRTNYRQVHRLAVRFFKQKMLDEITQGDAEAFRVDLKARGLSEGNIRRRCGILRQFFTAAVKHRLISENPLAGLKCSNFADKTRQRFITTADIEKVLGACPDAEWRCIVALCRYGGLRCPSEVLALKWSDINWKEGTFTVRACKTEHHEDGGVRVVPIFGALLPYLLACFEASEPGAAVHVITRYRDAAANLRTQFGRIIERAGLTLWDKLFVNLRASCATEVRRKFGEYLATKWLGHTKQVAENHYWSAVKEDFEAASAWKADA